MKKKNSFIQAGLSTRRLSLLMVVGLLLTSMTFIAGATTETFEITENYSFSMPTFTDVGDYLQVSVEGADGNTGLFGAPELAATRGSVWLPEHAEAITVTTSNLIEHTGMLEKPLSPCPIPEPLSLPGADEVPAMQSHDDIYSSHEPYGEFFSYTIGRGYGPQGDGVVVTYELNPVVLTDPAENLYAFVEGDIQVTISYELETSLWGEEEEHSYDLVIICADAFVNDLQPLVTHKEDMGLATKLVSMQDILEQVYFDVPEDIPYQRDEAEQLKYFIYQAKQKWDMTYVMFVGGYRSFWGLNRPEVQIPVRWIRDINAAELGYTVETYYSCCVDADGNFDSWDTNNNDKFGENQDSFDHFPDVLLGRLACRNRIEVRTIVDKIITYETETYGQEWFNSFMTVGGDGFQDLGLETPTSVTWDTNGLPQGQYTIYAQSWLASDTTVKGPIDSVLVNIDHMSPSRLSFEESDHEKIEPLDEEQERLYPAKPVAEIVSPSNDNILGNTNVHFTPPEAYIGESWATVSYQNGNMYIRVKSYDPSPKDNVNNFGSKTFFKVWVNNSEGNTVFESSNRYSEIYYENEMGNQLAHNYMDEFQAKKLWTSNGNFIGMWDVIDAFSEGNGFVFINGHSSCMSWMDHYPGIPGGRDDGGVAGIASINMRFGLSRYAKAEGDPLLPLDNLYNGDKLPVFLFSGCHSGQFDTSFMRMLADPDEALFGDLYNTWAPEGMAWWATRLPQGGSIGTIGNAALGYGYLGEACILGLGGWLYPQFTYVYADNFNEYDDNDILGQVFTQALIDFAEGQPPQGFDLRTFEIMTLIGDPSLKIGGYPPATASTDFITFVPVSLDTLEVVNGRVHTNLTNLAGEDVPYLTAEIRLDEISPLAKFMGLQGTILEPLLGGHIFKGQVTTKEIAVLKPGETMELYSDPFFGLGHVAVNTTIYQYEEPLVTIEEDGFVIGSRIVLYEHPYPLQGA